jgi:hypothetical protein
MAGSVERSGIVKWLENLKLNEEWAIKALGTRNG